LSTRTPRSRSTGSAGSQEPNLKLNKVCVMSIRYLDRLAPAFLLFLGMVAAGATAGLGI